MLVFAFLTGSLLLIVLGLPLGAILGPSALRVKGDLRIGAAYLNLLDLGCILVIYLTAPPSWGIWANPFGASSVIAALILGTVQLGSHRFTNRLTTFLPVRGHYGRRLLATLTIALSFAPLLQILFRVAQGERVDTDGVISAPVVLIFLGLLFLYLLPLWDVLARGWHLDGRD